MSRTDAMDERLFSFFGMRACEGSFWISSGKFSKKVSTAPE